MAAATKLTQLARAPGAVATSRLRPVPPVTFQSAALRRNLQRAHSGGRGFANANQKPQADQQQSDGPSTSSSAPLDPDAEVEALEQALKRRRSRKGRIQPQVQVQSAVVDQVSGKAPTTHLGQAETTYLQALGVYFTVLLLEGLVLAGSGFLPENLDAAVQDYLYPSYTPQMLLFLGLSSLYGLWKTGKLPGQQQT